MNKEWSQPTVWVFVHRVGFYMILIRFQHALKLMAPINCVDFLIILESTYKGGIGWEEVSFISSLCKLVWLHGFLRQYLFGYKVSFWVESMVGPMWDFHTTRSASSAYLWIHHHLSWMAENPSGNCPSVTSYIGKELLRKSQHLAWYFPTNMPWPMTVIMAGILHSLW